MARSRRPDNSHPEIILPDENLYVPFPTLRQRKEALAEFEGLLERAEKKKKPLESEWQDFFNRNPFVLTETIPIKLDSLFSQVRLSSGPADYLFQKRESSPFFSTTGLIELKRPHHTILDIYGAHMSLARNTNHAVSQLKDYLTDLSRGTLIRNKTSLAIGNNKIVFIIIGMSKEIIQKCHNEELELKFSGLLPHGFQIFTYDHLLNSFRDKTPRAIQILVADELYGRINISSSLVKIQELMSQRGFDYIGSEGAGLVFSPATENNTLKVLIAQKALSIIPEAIDKFFGSHDYGGLPDDFYERRRLESHIDIGIDNFRFYWADEQWDRGYYGCTVDEGIDTFCDVKLMGEWVYDFCYEADSHRMKVICTPRLMEHLIVSETGTGRYGSDRGEYFRECHSFDLEDFSIIFEPTSNSPSPSIIRQILDPSPLSL